MGIQFLVRVFQAGAKEVIQRQPAFQDTVENGRSKPGVPGVQPGTPQRLIDDNIGVALVFFHLQQRLQCCVPSGGFHSTSYLFQKF